MNKVERQNLLNIVDKYRNVCMNIDTFTDFLSTKGISDLPIELIPQTAYNKMRNGHYANLLHAKLWIAGYTPYKTIMLSNEKITSTKKCQAVWSPAIPLKQATLDYIERLANLKTLW